MAAVKARKQKNMTRRSTSKVRTRRHAPIARLAARLAAMALLGVLAIGVFQGSAQAQGCSMCRSGLENSPDMKGLAPNINRGILFLMGVPYVLFGTVGIVVYRAHRKNKAAARRNDNPYIPRD